MRKFWLLRIIEEISHGYKALFITFLFLALCMVYIHTRFTVPISTRLEIADARSSELEKELRDLDRQIIRVEEEALIRNLKRYFDEDTLRDIVSGHLSYDIRINGIRVTEPRITLDSGEENIQIIITEYIRRDVFPESLLYELSVIKDCNEAALNILSVYTTKSDYTVTYENTRNTNLYIYDFKNISPGEIISITIDNPFLLSNINPRIYFLEVASIK